MPIVMGTREMNGVSIRRNCCKPSTLAVQLDTFDHESCFQPNNENSFRLVFNMTCLKLEDAKITFPQPRILEFHVYQRKPRVLKDYVFLRDCTYKYELPQGLEESDLAAVWTEDNYLIIYNKEEGPQSAGTIPESESSCASATQVPSLKTANLNKAPQITKADNGGNSDDDEKGGRSLLKSSQTNGQVDNSKNRSKKIVCKDGTKSKVKSGDVSTTSEKDILAPNQEIKNGVQYLIPTKTSWRLKPAVDPYLVQDLLSTLEEQTLHLKKAVESTSIPSDFQLLKKKEFRHEKEASNIETKSKEQNLQ